MADRRRPHPAGDSGDRTGRHPGHRDSDKQDATRPGKGFHPLLGFIERDGQGRILHIDPTLALADTITTAQIRMTALPAS